MPDGQAVHAYHVENARGHSITVLTLGGIIRDAWFPDRTGVLADLVLGMDDVAGYLTRSPYFGAVTGRYANRIAGGRFTLDGEDHEVTRNDGHNHLHGGAIGFDKRLFAGRALERRDGAGVRLTLVSPDGDEGYPGELACAVRYLLTDDDRLVIDYRATSTRPTHVNLAQHSYFHLGGAGNGSVLQHELVVHADRYTPVDEELLPSGELAHVAGTPFDFRVAHTLGERILDPDPQLHIGGGYDHNYVLRPARPTRAPRMAAELFHPESGRTLTVRTTEPGLQLYTGNFLAGSFTGKGGVEYGRHAGVCLETQHWPDTPNQPRFPSTVLRPGQVFRSRTVYAFGVRAPRAAAAGT